METCQQVWLITRDDGNKFVVVVPIDTVYDDMVEKAKSALGGNELVVKRVESGVFGVGADFGILSSSSRCVKGTGAKPTLFCQACGEIDGELHRWWLELRDDGTKRDHVAASIEFAFRLRLLSEDSRELWLRRIATCPGHDDEGGRSWCAYCGELEREEDGSGA